MLILKIRVMTKKEIHQSINKNFYKLIEDYYPQYMIDDSEGFGRVSLIHQDNGINGNWDEVIEYHQSRHDLCWLK